MVKSVPLLLITIAFFVYKRSLERGNVSSHSSGILRQLSFSSPQGRRWFSPRESSVKILGVFKKGKLDYFCSPFWQLAFMSLYLFEEGEGEQEKEGGSEMWDICGVPIYWHLSCRGWVNTTWGSLGQFPILTQEGSFLSIRTSTAKGCGIACLWEILGKSWKRVVGSAGGGLTGLPREPMYGLSKILLLTAYYTEDSSG